MGVGFYVRASLLSSLRNDLKSSCESFETIWVEIEINNDKNLLLCCAYRHPTSAIENLTNYVVNTLPKAVNKRVFIMGDVIMILIR